MLAYPCLHDVLKARSTCTSCHLHSLYNIAVQNFNAKWQSASCQMQARAVNLSVNAAPGAAFGSMPTFGYNDALPVPDHYAHLHLFDAQVCALSLHASSCCHARWR